MFSIILLFSQLSCQRTSNSWRQQIARSSVMVRKPAGDSRSQKHWSVFAITYHQFVSSMWQVRILNYITLSIPIIHPRFDFWCSLFWLRSCSLFTACIRPLKHEFWCKTSLSISCSIAHVRKAKLSFREK